MWSTYVFISLFLFSFGLFIFNLNRVRKNILLGRSINRSDKPLTRLKTMALVALGQKKMFTRPIAAFLHLALYVAFVITQIELVEIIADGFSGQHRMFYFSLGSFYVFMVSFIEILTVLAFIATVAFLWRRNMLSIPRFNKTELLGWPKKDANLILIMEIVLIVFILTMNGADEVLYNRGGSHVEYAKGSFGFSISSWLGPLVFDNFTVEALRIFERIGWWGHIGMVFLFLNYLPYSKHLHILLAFPTTYFSNLQAKGKFSHMKSVENEVKLMLDPNADPYSATNATDTPERFGVKDVTDLTWKNLLDAYSCTECGRCTDVCPANITGKALSPRKIMMDTRDRMVEVGELKKGVVDGKSLLGDYISPEEVWACTSCNACVEACPINIDPLSIIIDLRRNLVMEDAAMPSELAGMLTNIENNGAPWQFAQSDRLNWLNEE
jgi:heterodisulfide reductase subunit C